MTKRPKPTPPRDVAGGVRAFIARHGVVGDTPPAEQMRDTDAVGFEGARAAATLVVSVVKQDGARVVKLTRGWQPEAMLTRGLITPRQHDAAVRLMHDYDAAGFDKVKGQSWGEVVDSGEPSSDVPHMLAMKRRRIMDMLRALPPLVREVVEHVVLAGRTVETAAATLRATWLPANAKLRRTSARAFLGLGLEQIADAYGI